MSTNHQHDHSHHNHGHGHHHHHAITQNLGVAFWLNLFFCLIEFIGAYFTNSMAVFSDALHDLGDALALGFSYFIEKKSHTHSDANFSYGYRRLSVLSALFVGSLLVVGSCFALMNCWSRLFNPEPVYAPGVIALGVLGIAINGYAAFRVARGSSLVEKMVTLHLLEDLFGWIIVLIGAVLIHFFNWTILDPILAIVLAVWVLYNAFKNLRQALQVFLQGVPAHILQNEVKQTILSAGGLKDVHHLHIWSLDGDSHVLTAHVVLEKAFSFSEFALLKIKIKKLLHDRYHITEATLEAEIPEEVCHDPEHN